MPADELGHPTHAKTLPIRGPEPMPPTEPTPPPATHSAHSLLAISPAHLWPEVPGYEILGELGRGGMGVVFKARQERLNRTVAVKMLLNHRYADMSDVVRFRSEAEAVAAVAHPHVVKVFESGQHDGRPYFVMEFLPGGTLHAKLRAKAPLAPDVSSDLVEKLARAVHAAHQQGIVHRDMKPGNVLFDADGEPRVTDFGLAKRSSQELTKTQVVMGTPAYMPPEQAAGRAKYAGPPADIYALGVILYECLTGHTPFAGDDSLVMIAQVIAEPPPSPRSKVANLPRDLELICLKCLEKEPADRYQTAAELADDLRRFLNREPVSVRPAGAIERAVKWAKRRPTLAAAYALAAVAAVLLLFGGGMFALWLQAEHARQMADANATQADEARHEAQTNWQSAENARGQLAQQNDELERSLERETAAKAAAEKARLEADKARGELEKMAYFRDVGAAVNEARAGNVRRARQLLEACPKIVRGWEWHFADRLAHPEVRSVACRFGPTDLAYTKDGLCLFEPTGQMIPVDAAGRLGKPVTVAPPGVFYHSTVTPDGKRFVGITQPEDKTKPGKLEVWQTSDGKKLGSWPVPNVFPLLLTAANGGRILTGFLGGKLMAFDPAEKEPLWVLDKVLHENHMPNVSPDGNWLVVDSHMDIALVDVTKGQVAARMAYPGGRLRTSAVSPDGKQLVVGDMSGHLSWFNRGEKKPTRVVKACSGSLTGVTFSPDGKTVACGGHDGTVRLYAADSGAEVALFRGHTALVLVLQFSPDGTELATCDEAAQCYCWAVGKPNGPVTALPLPPELPAHVFVRPDLARLFAHPSVGNQPAVICDADGRNRSLIPPPVRNIVNRFDFQPGGNGFACGSGQGPVEYWPDPIGPPVRAANHDMYVGVVQFSGDGRLLMSGSQRRLCVWDTKEKKEVFREEKDWERAAISPDGKRVVTCSGNKYKLIDLPSGKATTWDGMHSAGELRFTPDSTGLLVGELDWGVAWVTLGADGKPVGEPRRYLGHTEMVRSAVISPDGKRIAGGGEDGTVKVWDTASGQEVLGLTVRDQKAVRQVFFTADGRLVATPEDGPPVMFDGRPRGPSK